MSEVKRGFIRGLWGIYEHEGRRLYKRRGKIDHDIRLCMHNKNNEPFRVYVFGEDNYKYLVDLGFDCKLVDKKPILWDMDTQQYRHKLEVFYQGLQEFDEVVFLDWDCQPIKPLPDNFWEVLGQKAPIQGALNIYHRRKAHWRKQDQRKVPCAEFIYLRGKEVGDDLVDLWENTGRPWSEEVVMARYIDNLVNDDTRALDLDKYWELYEPDFFILNRGIFSPERVNSKNICFKHFHMKNVPSILKQINKKNLKGVLAEQFGYEKNIVNNNSVK